MKRVSIIVIAIVCAIAFGADAYGRGGGGKGGMGHGGHHRKWWKESKTVKKLNLTEKQIESINEISSDEKKGHIRIRSELEILQVDMDDAMEAKELDSGEVSKLIDKYASLKAKMYKGRMKSLLEIRKVLTQEQYLKLKEMRPERGGRRGKKGKKGGRGGGEGRHSEGMGKGRGKDKQ